MDDCSGNLHRRLNLLKKTLFVSAGVFATAVVVNLLTPRDRGTIPIPLSVPDKALAFGPVPAQPAFQWTVPVTNTSNRDVAVKSIQTSCACTSVSPQSFTIAPGDTAKVRIVLDLRPTNVEDAAAQTRAFNVRLAAIVNAGLGVAQQVKWELSGTISQSLELRPALVYFGETLVSGMSFPRKVVRVHSPQKLRSLHASCDPSVAQVSVSPLDDRGQQFEVAFVLNESFPASVIDAQFSLEATALDGTQMPTMPVPVRGKVNRPIYTVPEALYFGEQQVTAPFTAQLAIRSSSAGPLELLATEHEQEIEAVVSPARGQSNELAVKVTVRSRSTGHHESLLKLFVGNGKGETETLSVPLRWYAVDASQLVEADGGHITCEVQPNGRSGT